MADYAITGAGAVTPAGLGVDNLDRVLRTPQACVKPVDWGLDGPTSLVACGEVSDFDASEHLERREVKRSDRTAQMTVIAAEEAIVSSGLKESGWKPDRTAVVEGTSMGVLGRAIEEIEQYIARGSRRLKPGLLGAVSSGTGGALLAMRNDIRGPVLGVSDGSVSSIAAISCGLRLLQAGEADAVVVSGSECPLTRAVVELFARGGLLSRRSQFQAGECRPFDRDRDGILLGEGASSLVIERSDEARDRGANILGYIEALTQTTDAYDLAAPHPEGTELARAVSLALQLAGWHPDDLDYVSAHGTGPPQNDLSESRALRRALGEHADEIPVSSIKPVFGHTLGACGIIEVLAVLLSFRGAFLPPTLNLENPDPECDLYHIQGSGLKRPVRRALSVNVSFGGRNSAIVLSAPESAS